MSLKYFRKYNIYYGKRTARTSVWLTLWPKVLPKPGNSYNWNCGFIFLPGSLVFPFLCKAIFFKVSAVNFCFPEPSLAKLQAILTSSPKHHGKEEGVAGALKETERNSKITPGISRSLSNWNAHWQALDLSLFWLHRRFLFCTQPCVKTWGIEHVPPLPQKKIKKKKLSQLHLMHSG